MSPLLNRETRLPVHVESTDLFKMKICEIGLTLVAMTLFSCLIFHCELWLISFLRDKGIQKHRPAKPVFQQFVFGLFIGLFYVLLGVFFVSLAALLPAYLIFAVCDNCDVKRQFVCFVLPIWGLPSLIYMHLAYKKFKR